MEASLVARVLDLAVATQQVPAPPFGEAQRSAFIRDRFEVEGLAEVSVDELGNVYGCLPGKDSALKPVVVSAHLDTVFPFDVDLKIRREAEKIFGPGIGDNSLGIAGLFGLLWCLQQKPEAAELPGDVWLVANVGEEGLGDLRGMRAVVDRFEGAPRAYIVLEGMALGQVYHRALGVQRYRISVRANGGHSWVDYGKPSAIHELARLVNRICELEVPSQPRSSMNVGIIAGGTSVNTIAAEAHLELDLRSEGSAALQELVRRVEMLVKEANRSGVEATWDLIGQRPAGKLAINHPLVRLAKRTLLEMGVTPNLTIGSTDANIPLSRGLPAICVGLSTGFGAHTSHEYINTGPVAQGLEQVEKLVRGCFEEIE